MEIIIRFAGVLTSWFVHSLKKKILKSYEKQYGYLFFVVSTYLISKVIQAHAAPAHRGPARH